MGFEDLARRMRSQRGGDVGGNPLLIDPDRVVAEAAEAAERSQRVKDLVLGPLLLVGGILVGLLMYSTLKQAVAATGSVLKTLAMTTFLTKLLLVSPVVAMIVGAHKILRGLGILKQ